MITHHQQDTNNEANFKGNSFQHIETGEKVSAYQYGKDNIWSEWRELKDSGAIPEESSDFNHPNCTDQDYLKWGMIWLLNDEAYVKC